MPGKSKTAPKRPANVDRYGVNVRAAEEAEEGDAGAEEASLVSNDEEMSNLSELDGPLLEGGEEDDENQPPPKEWKLADGSPVFRAGKKSLRVQPRKNRRGNGEDSDEYRRQQRIARGEPVTPREEEPAPIIPVPSSIKPIASFSPLAQRPKKDGSSRQPSPLKTKPKEFNNSKQSAPAFTSLLPALFIAALLGASIFYLLFGSGNTTTIAFTGSSENYTTLDQIIADHDHFKTTTERLSTLENKFSELSQQLTKSIQAQSEANLAGLKKQKDEISQEIKFLRESLVKSLAEKIDATQLENSIQPALLKQKKELQNTIDALTARIVDLEARPISSGSSGDNVPLAELTALKKSLINMESSLKSVKETLDRLAIAETELKSSIQKELVSPAAQQAIVSAINKHIANPEFDQKDTIQSLVDTVLKSSKSIQKSTTDLAAVYVQVAQIEADVKDLQKRPVGTGTPSTGTVDTTHLERRLDDLEKKITSGSGPVSTPVEIVKLSSEIEALKLAISNVPTVNEAQLNGKIEDLRNRVESLTSTVSSLPNSGSQQQPNNAQVMEDVRKEIAKELARRVTSGTSIVGRPDHALYLNGARPYSAGTGWDPEKVRASGSGFFGALFSGAPRTGENTPSVVLDSNMTPGSCWPIPDHQGNFSVILSYPVIPSAFTIDHIPKSEALQPGSMPRTFNIYGYNPHLSKDDIVQGKGLVRLLSGEYKDDGPSAQSFEVSPQQQQKEKQAFQVFMLSITSNYGTEYTCLYRFRVHGEKAIAQPNHASSNNVASV
jgi:tetrahydromethanopterin S-methyltransferase subunit G